MKNWSNKLKIYLILFFSVMILSAYLYKKYRIAPDLDLTELNLTDVSGNTFDPSGIEADLIIVNFWASWCGPCRQELPILSELNTRLDEKKVAIVMISDEDHRSMNRFLSGKNYSMDFYKMEERFNDIEVFTIPTTYFLDSDFRVVRSQVNGIDWHSPELLGWIQSF